MPTIGFVPLDNRPCTKDFPNQIAQIASAQVLLPPPEALGHFLDPGCHKILADWLIHVSPELDYLILSIDMLTYGGLIGSRTPTVSKEEAIKRLRIIETLKEINPNLKIYAWNVLMRISITVYDDLTAQYWEQMNRYSVLWAKNEEGLLNTEENELFQELTQTIPQSVQDTYFAARRRNHEVNRTLVRLTKEGAVDILILCQEDAHPIGPHKLEQKRLLELIDPSELQNRIFLHPGADESGLNLLARAFCDYYGHQPSIAHEFFPNQARYSIPVFEDIPLEESLISQSLACGLRVTSGDAHLRGLLYGPSDSVQGLDVWKHQKQDETNTDILEQLWNSTAASVQKGEMPILFDVRNPNGSDVQLIHFLEGRDMPVLTSYAGWNTAGNTIGTALAHGTIYAIAKAYGMLNKKAQVEFMVGRILDDYVYQRIVRDELGEMILQNPHWGTRHKLTSEARQSLSEIVQSKLQQWADEWLLKFGWPQVSVQATLPWPRIFEVSVHAELIDGRLMG